MSVGIESQQGGGGIPILENGNRIFEMTTVDIQEDLSIAMDENLTMLGKRRRSSSDDNSDTMKKQSRN